MDLIKGRFKNLFACVCFIFNVVKFFSHVKQSTLTPILRDIFKEVAMTEVSICSCFYTTVLHFPPLCYVGENENNYFLWHNAGDSEALYVQLI